MVHVPLNITKGEFQESWRILCGKFVMINPSIFNNSSWLTVRFCWVYPNSSDIPSNLISNDKLLNMLSIEILMAVISCWTDIFWRVMQVFEFLMVLFLGIIWQLVILNRHILTGRSNFEFVIVLRRVIIFWWLFTWQPVTVYKPM